MTNFEIENSFCSGGTNSLGCGVNAFLFLHGFVDSATYDKKLIVR